MALNNSTMITQSTATNKAAVQADFSRSIITPSGGGYTPPLKTYVNINSINTPGGGSRVGGGGGAPSESLITQSTATNKAAVQQQFQSQDNLAQKFVAQQRQFSSPTSSVLSGPLISPIQKVQSTLNEVRQKFNYAGQQMKTLATPGGSYNSSALSQLIAPSSSTPSGPAISSSSILSRPPISRIPAFIEQKQVGTTKVSGGKNVPLYKTYVTDSSGNIIRQATAQEEKQLPSGVIAPMQQPKGLIEKGIAAIERSRSNLYASHYRSISNAPAANLLYNVEGAGLGLASAGLGFVGAVKNLATQPVKTLKAVPSSVTSTISNLRSGKVAQTILQEPGFVTGEVAGNLAIGYGTGKVAEFLKNVGSNILTRVSPGYKPIVGVGSNSEAIQGLSLSTGKQDIGIINKGFQPQMSTSAKASLQGKTTTAVSAQANLPKNIYKGGGMLNEPFPSQFFSNPGPAVRVSRLSAETKSASISDILSGNAVVRKPKPGIFINPQASIGKFPASLADISAKLKAGKSLTPSQTARLEKYLATPTGNYKPYGQQRITSTEAEIILSPGESLGKVKRVGTTLYPKGLTGKRIPIYEYDLFNPSSSASAKNLGDLSLANPSAARAGASPFSLSSYSNAGTSYFSGIRAAVGSVSILGSLLSEKPQKSSLISRGVGGSGYNSLTSYSNFSPSVSTPPGGRTSSGGTGQTYSFSSPLSSPGGPSGGSPQFQDSPVPYARHKKSPLELFQQQKKPKAPSSPLGKVKKEQIIYSPDFAAKTLGIRSNLTNKQLYNLAASGTGGLQIRGLIGNEAALFSTPKKGALSMV